MRKTATLCALLVLLSACKTQTQIVERIKTETIEKHDTLHSVDTLMRESTTVVRELDSLALARYGIQLEGLQRAWLVETARLEREIHRQREASVVRDTVRDSIPVPYPVEKLVEKPLNWWQRFRMHLGTGALLLAAGGVAFWLLKKKLLS